MGHECVFRYQESVGQGNLFSCLPSTRGTNMVTLLMASSHIFLSCALFICLFEMADIAHLVDLHVCGGW